MLGVAEDVRVAAFELVANAVDHVVERKTARFLGHLGVEHDLELKIAELVRERVHVVPRDRVSDLIGFLDGVRRNGREALLAVPFAAADRIAESSHDGDEAGEISQGGAPRSLYL